MPTQHVHDETPAGMAVDGNVTATLWSRATAQHPNEVFRYWRDGSWRGLTWAQAGERVRDIAGGLIALGVSPGDRVAVFSDTRMEWSLADLAILSAGAATVAVPAACSAEQCRRILTESRAGVVIVGTAGQAQLVEQAGAPGVGEIFVLDDAGLEAIVHRGSDATRDQVSRRVAATSGDDLATIIATTAADGALDCRPHTHGDLRSAARRCEAVLRPRLGRGEATLLVLPLAGAFARLGQFVCLEADVPVGYPRSADSVVEDLQSYGPTFLLATPRVLEQLLTATQDNAEGGRRKIFDFAVGSAEQWAERAQRTALDTIRRTIADKLVYREVRDALGGQIRFCLVEDELPVARPAAFFDAAGISIVAVDGGVASTAGTLQR